MRIDYDQLEKMPRRSAIYWVLCMATIFDEALAFTTNPPHQQGLCQGAPIGYGLALPPTANKGAMPMPPPGANKDLPRRYVAEWLKLPARMPIRTYNRDFDVPRRQARRGLFDPKVEQGPLELYHNLAWVRCKAPARGLTRSECGARDCLRVAEEVVPVASATGSAAAMLRSPPHALWVGSSCARPKSTGPALQLRV